LCLGLWNNHLHGIKVDDFLEARDDVLPQHLAASGGSLALIGSLLLPLPSTTTIPSPSLLPFTSVSVSLFASFFDTILYRVSMKILEPGSKGKIQPAISLYRLTILTIILIIKSLIFFNYGYVLVKLVHLTHERIQ
jgi:hypothetical protein